MKSIDLTKATFEPQFMGRDLNDQGVAYRHGWLKVVVPFGVYRVSAEVHFQFYWERQFVVWGSEWEMLMIDPDELGECVVQDVWNILENWRPPVAALDVGGACLHPPKKNNDHFSNDLAKDSIEEELMGNILVAGGELAEFLEERFEIQDVALVDLEPAPNDLVVIDAMALPKADVRTWLAAHPDAVGVVRAPVRSRMTLPDLMLPACRPLQVYAAVHTGLMFLEDRAVVRAGTVV